MKGAVFPDNQPDRSGIFDLITHINNKNTKKKKVNWDFTVNFNYLDISLRNVFGKGKLNRNYLEHIIPGPFVELV